MRHHLTESLDSVHIYSHLTLPFSLYSDPDPTILQDNINHCVTAFIFSYILANVVSFPSSSDKTRTTLARVATGFPIGAPWIKSYTYIHSWLCYDEAMQGSAQKIKSGGNAMLVGAATAAQGVGTGGGASPSRPAGGEKF